MKTMFIIVISALVLSSSAFADYQFEGNLDYWGWEQGGDELDFWTVNGAYYFKAVNDSEKPLVEAAFLEQATSVFIEYSDFESGTTNQDGDWVLFGGRYIEKDSGLILGISYWMIDQLGGGEQDTTSLDLGIYLTQSSAVILRYENVDSVGYDGDIVSVNYKNIIATNNSNAFNLEASLAYEDRDFDRSVFNTFDEETTLSAASDYYFNNKTSLGANLDLLFTDEIDGDEITYELRARHFFNTQFGINLSFIKTKFDDNYDRDIINIGVTGRY